MGIVVESKPKKRFKKPFYTIDEAAKILDLHPNTLYRLCRSGKLGAYKSGEGKKTSWRIPGEGLEGLRVPEVKTGPKPKQKEGAE